MVAMTLIRIGVEINSCTKNRSTKTTIWLHRAEAPSRRGQSSGRRLKEIRGWAGARVREEVQSVILGLECVFIVKGLFPMGGEAVEGVHSRVMIPGPS